MRDIRYKLVTISPGSLVALASRPSASYEVVNVDDFSDCVWVRRWPVDERHASTFGVPIEQVLPLPTREV